VQHNKYEQKDMTKMKGGEKRKAEEEPPQIDSGSKVAKRQAFSSSSANNTLSNLPSYSLSELTAPKGPLVFSCRACRSSIGDSLALLGTYEEMGLISLCRASSIRRTSILNTVIDNTLDKGSTFFPIECACCSVEIGRYMHAPNRAA
jgi:hypothetical protein